MRILPSLGVGLAAGLVDAFFVERTLALPLVRVLFFIPLVWIALSLLVRLVVFRGGDVAVVIAASLLLLLGRIEPALRGRGVPLVAALALCVLALAVAVLVVRKIPARVLAIAGWAAVAWLVAIAPFALRIVERHAPAAGVRAAAAGSPNVLLIFLDTVRADDARQLPNLSRFASTATTYDRAWAPAPWTLPSHFGMLTGIAPWRVPYDAAARRFLYDGPTLAERFAARGYATAAIFANPFLEPDPLFHRGFQEFVVSPRCVPCFSGPAALLIAAARRFTRWDPVVDVPPDWMKASAVTERALDTIRDVKQPYFLALNYMDAHSPYYLDPACGASVNLTPDDWSAWRNTYATAAPLAPERAARFRARYRAALQCMDRSLGKLLDAVQRTNTIVAIAGDHGEEFGTHDMVGHGQSLYRQCLHVPFIVRMPGQPPQRVATAVSTLDVYDRLLFGNRLPPPQPVIAEYKVRESPHPAKFAEASCAVRGRHHLIQFADGSAELYDLESDFDETKPLPIAPDDRELALLIAELHRNVRDINPQVVGLRGLGYLQ